MMSSSSTAKIQSCRDWEHCGDGRRTTVEGAQVDAQSRIRYKNAVMDTSRGD